MDGGKEDGLWSFLKREDGPRGAWTAASLWRRLSLLISFFPSSAASASLAGFLLFSLTGVAVKSHLFLLPSSS